MRHRSQWQPSVTIGDCDLRFQPSHSATNTATNQNNVQLAIATSTNPITIGPYSVTTVHW